MVAFGLELGEHDQRDHHLVLREPPERPGVGQQHRGVEDVGAIGATGTRARSTDDADGIGHGTPMDLWRRTDADRLAAGRTSAAGTDDEALPASQADPPRGGADGAGDQAGGGCDAPALPSITSTTWSAVGPWAPSVRSCSISPVRLGP